MGGNHVTLLWWSRSSLHLGQTLLAIHIIGAQPQPSICRCKIREPAENKSTRRVIAVYVGLKCNN